MHTYGDGHYISWGLPIIGILLRRFPIVICLDQRSVHEPGLACCCLCGMVAVVVGGCAPFVAQHYSGTSKYLAKRLFVVGHAGLYLTP